MHHWSAEAFSAEGSFELQRVFSGFFDSHSSIVIVKHETRNQTVWNCVALKCEGVVRFLQTSNRGEAEKLSVDGTEYCASTELRFGGASVCAF